MDIIIKNLNVSFCLPEADVNALKNVDIRFKAGETTALIGESGSGKSVLGMSILGLLPQYAAITGSCTYRGQNLLTLKDDAMQKIRGREIGLIAQNPALALNSVLTVKRQLCEGLIWHKLDSPSSAYQKICGLLKKFAFADPDAIMDSYPFALSGGMQQRILTCMGISCQPFWLIADEPTKGLDGNLRRQIYSVFQTLKQSGQENMIIITHDLRMAQLLCDKTAIMYQGEIVEYGFSRDIFNCPRHPYTRGLLNSLPASGMRPILQIRQAKQPACSFFNCCPYAKPSCRDKRPLNYELENERRVRCLMYA